MSIYWYHDGKCITDNYLMNKMLIVLNRDKNVNKNKIARTKRTVLNGVFFVRHPLNIFMRSYILHKYKI